MTNRFRPVYRKLDDSEQNHIDEIKNVAESLARLMEKTPSFIIGRDRYVALALTSLETSVMWCVKAATGPKSVQGES